MEISAFPAYISIPFPLFLCLKPLSLIPRAKSQGSMSLHLSQMSLCCNGKSCIPIVSCSCVHLKSPDSCLICQSFRRNKPKKQLLHLGKRRCQLHGHLHPMGAASTVPHGDGSGVYVGLRCPRLIQLLLLSLAAPISASCLLPTWTWLRTGMLLALTCLASLPSPSRGSATAG